MEPANRQAGRLVFLVTVDCLRADHVSGNGYGVPTTPVLDATAAEGVSFPRAYSTAGHTAMSFPGLLLSNFFQNFGRSRAVPPHLTTLAEALAEHGFRTVAFNAGNVQISHFYGYDRGFSEFHDFIDERGRDADTFEMGMRPDDAALQAVLADLRARPQILGMVEELTGLRGEALEQHWAAHEEFGFDPRCVLLGGRSFPPAYIRRFLNYLYEAAWLYMPLHRPRPRFMGDYQWFVTCNLSRLAEAYERFGFYDPAFTWASDTELGRRWQKARCMNLYVDTSIQGYHLHELTFEGHRANCLKRAPFQFHLRTGRWPCEATEEERQEARDALEAQVLDVPAFKVELLRLEAEWAGPDAFAGMTVMGKRARTLRELNYLITPLLRSYRTYLYCTELLRLMARYRTEVAVRERAG